MSNNLFQKTVRPTRMLLSQTGEYGNQVYRPFETNIDVNSINLLKESSMDGSRINDHSVALAAGNIIQPSSRHTGDVGIQHGWGFRRFRFIMNVLEEQHFRTGATTEHVFYGYTDHCDVAHQHSATGVRLDPNMRVYFNSEVVISHRTHMTANGPVVTGDVVANNQIVNGYSEDESVMINGQRVKLVMLRPEDVYSNAENKNVMDRIMSSPAMQGHLSNRFVNGEPVGIYDERSAFHQLGDQKYSRRNELSPTRYLSRALNGYKKASMETGADESYDDFASSDSSLYGNAASYLHNDSMINNEFLRRLREETAYGRLGYVTYGELCAMFPGFDDQCVQVAMDDGRSMRRMSSRDDGEVWTGQDANTIASSLLSQVVPGIMMDCMLTNIHFTVVNGEGYGQFRVLVSPQSVMMISDKLDPSQFVQRFIDRLSIEAMVAITQNNLLGIQLDMATDIVGESIIRISINGTPWDTFIAPTFADSTYTLMLSTDPSALSKISNDISWLASQVVGIPSGNLDTTPWNGYTVDQSQSPDGIFTEAPMPQQPTQLYPY